MTRLVVLVVCLVAPVAAGAPPATTATADGSEPVGAWPLAPVPEVVTGFDPPATAYGAGHRGVDLAGSEGQPVRAAMAGRVVFTGMLAGRPVVAVDHGSTRTTYEPVASGIPRGRWVDRGERIGRLETVGSHCLPRPCLHWGWRRGEEYLDPLRLVGAGPVRLLPLAGGAVGAPRPSGTGGMVEVHPTPAGAGVPPSHGPIPV